MVTARPGHLMPLDADEVRTLDERRTAALVLLSTWEADGDERTRAAAAMMRRTIERHPKPFAQRCKWCDHVYPCPDLADVLDVLAPLG